MSSIPELEIGLGLDQLHPESKIPDGFVLDLVNVDPTIAGTLKKRRGWERFAGSIPLRVKSYSRSGTSLTLVFEDWVDVSEIRPGAYPIVVAGYAPGTNHFSTDSSARYYSTYTVAGATSIVVTDGASGTIASSTGVQLCVWGIPVEDVVSDSAGDRAGWITGLSTYRSTAAEHLVAISGGVVYAALHRNDVADAARSTSAAASTHLIPSQFAQQFSTTTAGTKVIGRAFYDVDPTTPPDRGYIRVNSAPTGHLRVLSATYDAGTTNTTFVLDAPGSPASTKLAGVLRPNIDFLSVEGMGAAFDGEHAIVATPTVASDQISVTCAVLTNRAADTQKTELTSYGRAGCFSDRIPVAYTSNYLIEGDRLDTSPLPYEDYGLSVLRRYDDPNTLTAAVDVGPVGDPVSIAGSTKVFGSRTGRALVPGNSSATSVHLANFVRGDVVSVGGQTRRIHNIRTTGTQTCAITSDGVEATAAGVTLATMAVGDYVLFQNAGVYSGIHEVTGFSGPNDFTFASTETDAVSNCRLLGEVIFLDSDVDTTSGVSVATPIEVERRWIPREAPKTSASGVTTTFARYLDLDSPDDQNYVSISQMNSNLYLANGRDEILKYDGTNVYRAGLPSWPFAITGVIRWSDTPITSPTSNLPVESSGNSSTTRRFVVTTAGDEEGFAAGDHVEIVDVSAGSLVVGAEKTLRTTVSGVFTSTSEVKVTDEYNGVKIVGDSHIYKQMEFRYYFRAVYTDTNGNRIPGPAVRSQDLVFRVGAPAEVQFLVSAFPTADAYPWDRLELEIYRTQGEAGAPPFGLVGTLAFPFDASRKYIHFRDVIPVFESSAETIDPTSSLTGGASVGSRWRQPPTAKYAATAANRLVLANIRSPQRMIATIRRPLGAASLPGARAPQLLLVREYGTNLTDPTNIADGIRLVPRLYATSAEHASRSGAIGSPLKIYQHDATSFVVDLSHPVAPPSLPAGSWIQMNHVGALGQIVYRGTPYVGWFQVAENLGSGLYRFRSPQTYSAPLTVTAFTGASDTWTTTTSTSRVSNGDPVYFRLAGGALPTGFSEYTTYYVRLDPLVSGDFTLHPTQADALANTNKIADTGGAFAAGVELHYGDADAFPNYAWYVSGGDSTDVPVYISGENGSAAVGIRTDLTYADVPRGDVTNVATDTYENYLVRRYADAINCVMRAVDRSISGYETFEPWILADAGADVGFGRLYLEAPKATDTAFAIGLVDSTTSVQLLIDGVLLGTVGGLGGPSSQLLFPSRLVRSYPNFPELFDRPFSETSLRLDSDSVIDISPDDGDEIVAIRPFFAESFSSGSSGSAREQLVLVEKQRAKYAVNVDSGEVQLIETNETGADFTRSAAPTKNGIASASNDGVFAVDRSLTLRHVGEKLGRFWTKQVNRDAVEDVPVGHHDASSRQYLLAVPLLGGDDESTNSAVVAYSYSRDPIALDQFGAWSRWEGFAPSAFAWHEGTTFYGGYAGAVFRRRDAGDSSDYRDDGAAIAARIDLRPTSFGASGTRKQVSGLQLEFRSEEDARNTRVSVATDLATYYLDADELVTEYREPTSGTGDTSPQLVWSVRYSFPQAKANYFAVRIENDGLDEGLDLCGITWNVETTGPDVGSAAARTGNRR